MLLSLLQRARLQLVQGDVVGFQGRVAAGGLEALQQHRNLVEQGVQFVDEVLVVGGVH